MQWRVLLYCMSCHVSGQSLRILFCRPCWLLVPFLLMLKKLHAPLLWQVDHMLFSSLARFSCSTDWGKYFGTLHKGTKHAYVINGMVPVTSQKLSTVMSRRAPSSLFADLSVRCSPVSDWSGGSILTHFSEEPSHHVPQLIVANRRESTTGAD